MKCIGVHALDDGPGLGDVEGALTLVQRFTVPTTSKKEIQLLLKGNPWIMPPEAVVEEGLSAVENYLIDVRMATEAGAQVTTAKLLKVVLVGSSQVGKTR